MRLKLMGGLAAVALVSAGLGWAGALYVIPYVATDIMWRSFEKAGAKHNRLSPATVRTARTAKVVADNPDTLTRSSIINLEDGPVLFEAEVPTGENYWSVSLFAHNTDTYFVANDRKTGAGSYRLLIKAKGQPTPAGLAVDDVAVSPSTKSFLIIRAIMEDRNDKPGVEALRATVLKARVTPVR
ncbi:MAG: DUF1254 domain-containing protein [Alphaproteobacteria bacterium]